jgi:hypothetical protein
MTTSFQTPVLLSGDPLKGIQLNIKQKIDGSF